MKKKNLLVLPGIFCSVLLFSLTSTISIKAEEREPIVVGNDGINSISEALEKANNGDTIKIPAGTYNEQLCITKPGITIDAEDGVILNGEGLKLKEKYSEIDDKYKNISGVKDEEKLESSHTMVCVYASDVTVKGLEIKGLKVDGPTSTVPIGIFVAAGSNNVTIDNCKVHDMGLTGYKKRSQDYNAHGILAKGKPENAITGLTIKSCTLYNLILGNSEALVVNGNVDGFNIFENTVYDCDNIGIDAIGYEQDKSENDRARNGEIHDNFVRNISSEKNKTYDDEHGNSDTCAAGIYVDGGKEIDVYNNLVTNCDIGIEVASEHENKAANDIKVYNNTLVENDNLAGIILGGSEVGENGEAFGCIFTKNTVYNTDNSCLEIQFAHSDSNVFEHNLFIAKKNADVYNESLDDMSKGNKITDNMSNTEIDSDYSKVKKANKTFKLKKVSYSDGILNIESSTSLEGYGSNYRTNVTVKK